MNIWAFPSFYPYDYPGRRWSGTFAHRQYKGLINSGANLKVILPVLWHPSFPFSELDKEWKMSRQLNFPKERIHEGVQIYHPRIANKKPNRLFGKDFAERYVDTVVNFFESNNIILNAKNDIFYAQWLPEAVLVQKVSERLGVKLAILGIGDDIITEPYKNPINMSNFVNLIKKADVRITNADYLGREMNKIMGKEYPYFVNYFGIDYEKFVPVNNNEHQLELRKKYNVPTNKLVILIVASPIVRKGWLDLLDALCDIKKVFDGFVLVGGYAGGADINILEEIKKRNLEENFFDQREIKPELLHEFYQLSDIFCLPSHWEGLATVISESMSCGLPVITTSVCGHPEIIENNKTGVLIDPKNSKLLAQQLIILLNDADKRVKLGTAAREFIVNVWGNQDQNSRKLLEIFKSVL